MSKLTFYKYFGDLEELCLVTATADTVLLPVNYVLRAHLKPKNDYEPIPSLARKRSPCSRNPVLLKEMTSLNA